MTDIKLKAESSHAEDGWLGFPGNSAEEIWALVNRAVGNSDKAWLGIKSWFL